MTIETQPNAEKERHLQQLRAEVISEIAEQLSVRAAYALEVRAKATIPSLINSILGMHITSGILIMILMPTKQLSSLGH